jgi:hypothetical protein
LFVALVEAHSGWLVVQLVSYAFSVVLVLFWKSVHDKRRVWMLRFVAILPSLVISVIMPASDNVMPLCIGFWNLFYIQGFLDQKFHEEHVDYTSRASWVMAPVATCGIIIAAILGVAVSPFRALFFFVGLLPFTRQSLNRLSDISIL